MVRKRLPSKNLIRLGMSFQFYANVIGFMEDNMIETLVASRLRLISVELFFWVHENHFMQIQLYGLEDLFGRNSKMFFWKSI